MSRARELVEQVVRGSRPSVVAEKVTNYSMAHDPEEIGIDLVAISADNTHILSKYLEVFRKRDVSGELLHAYDQGRVAISDVLAALKKLQSVGDQIQRLGSRDHR